MQRFVLVLLGCLFGVVSGAAQPVAGHPRIFLTPKRIEVLRANVRSSAEHQRFFAIVQDKTRAAALTDAPDFHHEGGDELWQREVGNMLPNLAMVWVVTGDRVYLDATKRWALKAAAYPAWGAKGIDLAAGHLLENIALVYDWCYAELTPGERAQLRAALLSHGQTMYEAAQGPAFWSNGFLQNHLWVNTTGMATAAFALEDEAPQVKPWIALTLAKFRQTAALLPPDGASQEGGAYWQYGVEYMLKFMDNARDLLGVDLFQNAWWKSTARYEMYFTSAPGTWSAHPLPTQSFNFSFGDSTRVPYYGPGYLMRKLAAEYRDGYAQTFADETDARKANVEVSPWLNLLWYSLAVARKPLAELPTLRLFDDLGIASSRSGWDPAASVVIFKGGPPLGHLATNTKAAVGSSAAHVQPDIGGFAIYGGGRILLRGSEYFKLKLTAYESSLRIDGQGQRGEGKEWFLNEDAFLADGTLRVLHSDADYDLLEADATRAYDPAKTGLVSFKRRFLYLKKDDALLVISDVELKEPRKLELDFQTEVLARMEKALPGGGSQWDSEDSTADMKIFVFDPLATARAQTLSIAAHSATGVPLPVLTLMNEEATRWHNVVAFTWASAVGGRKPAVVKEIAGDAAEIVFQVGEHRELTIDQRDGVVRLRGR